MSSSTVRSNCLARLVASMPGRLVMPLAVYPGTSLTGATVRDVVTSATAQAAAQEALHVRYRTPVVLSAMDLSVEAEAFGCDIKVSDTEPPTVMGRLVTSLEDAKKLRVPDVGEGRTAVHVDTVRRLRRLEARPLVVADCIGPLSLAARLVGVTQALELTINEPDIIHVLAEKSAAFLTAYVRALREAGADGVLMAEPVAGLLSPRALVTFSSAYIAPIARELADGHFALVLHNCAARLVHLPAVLESGASVFHFGAPMDMAAAVARVDEGVVLCGNLDPVRVFVQSSTEEVRGAARALLDGVGPRRNFVLSSGCDVPAQAPLANLDALHAECSAGA